METMAQIGTKVWCDATQRWLGAVVEVDQNNHAVMVLDIGTAETQIEIDDWITESIRTKPWLIAEDDNRGECS